MTTSPPDHPARYAEEAGLAADLQRIAQIAVREAAVVKEDERLLVLTDTGGDPRLADLVAAEGAAAGAEVVVNSFPSIGSIHDIPPRVEATILDSDVIIPLCRSRILYAKVLSDLRDRGGRMLYMADVPTEFFRRPIVLNSDYDELARLAAAFERIWSQSGLLTVTTSAGTDARMQLDAAREPSISSCRAANPGDKDYLPGGAWFCCPLEDTVEGTFVIDCSMEPGVTGGVVTQPVVLHVETGVVKTIEGGAQAEEFAEWLRSCDEQVWGISHNGGGFNRFASRIGNLMEDERILGSFNIAGGNNQAGWPGRNSSSFHWDAMMLDATYALGGEPICQDGQFVHPELVAAMQPTS